MSIDTAQALRALQVYTYGPFEVRVLLDDGTVSAVFGSPEQAAALLPELDAMTYSGVYVTPNPLREPGRVEPLSQYGRWLQTTTVGDADIARSAWLLLDVDPVRPKGCSSTSVEKSRAVDVRAACIRHLAAHGWPDPTVLADSGNGCHAMWRLGDGVTPPHLRRVLQRLDEACSNDGAKVDRSVFNASRIWKLPGTWARKGPDTPERPHRMARLEAVAEQPLVTLEMVEAFAPAPRELESVPRAARQDTASRGFREASEAYCRDRSPQWPRQRGPCPACGHNGCFGSLDGQRWTCWSSGHEGVGVQSADGRMWTGDVLDLDAHASGRTPSEHLRAEGYLEEWTPAEPDPYTEAFLVGLREEGRRIAEERSRAAVAAVAPSPVAPVVRDRGADSETKTGHYTHDLTGVGNAHRFAEVAGDDVMYVLGVGWRVWDGTRWVVDTDGAEVMRTARAVLRGLYAEAHAEPEPKLSAKALKWADSSSTAGGLTAMITIARSLPSLRAEASRFDAAPHLLNTPAGTVDLRTGELREHRRSDYLTQRTDVAPDFAGRASRFEAFLAEAMPVAEDRAFLERFAGYCAWGGVREHAFVINWGPSGRNGKSTFWEAVGSALGDYAGAAPREMLLLPPRGAAKAPTELVTLAGKRLVWASEPGAGRVVDAELVKAISGGDRFVVKRLYREPEEVRPNAKVTFLANDLRVLQTMDGAAWARAHVVEWPVSFLGREDHALSEALRDEAPQILAQLIRWAVAYRRHGLGAPSQTAKEAARRFQTPIEAFLAERCDVGAGHRVHSLELYNAFRGFCADLGIDENDNVPSSPVAFGKLLGSRFTSAVSNSIRYRVGLRLRGSPGMDDGDDFFAAASKVDAATIFDLDDARRRREEGRS